MLEQSAWPSAMYLEEMLNCLFRERPPQRTKGGQRKSRLYGCACCRVIWGRIPEGPCRLAVETAERYAVGEATKQDMKEALQAAVPFLGRGGISRPSSIQSC